MNRVHDGPACSGCGLPNYEGLCPHCRGNEEEINEMWPPSRSRIPDIDDDLAWDEFINKLNEDV